jgi:hypothetical protein
MQEKFVTYPIALELKRLGFDEECLAYFYNISKNRVTFKLFNYIDFLNVQVCTNSEFSSTNYITAPLYQDVVDWFRETHLIEISASSYYYPNHYGIVSQIGYSHKFNTEYSEDMYGDGLGKRQKLEKVIVYSERHFKSYYEALTQSILEAIKLLDTKT